MANPYENEDLASDLLAKQGGSFLRLVGGVLDTPGSTVRNLAALRNPFRGLFDIEDRLSGRDLLQKLGLPENTPGLDTGDVLGFLGEVALDPLTYASFGASALSKSGKAAKMAGIMPESLVDAASGKLVSRYAGKRFLSRARTLAEQIERATPAQRGHAEVAAKSLGSTLDDLIRSKEPLQRDINIGIPFGPELGSFSIPGSERVASFIDTQANKLRTSPVGEMAYRLFSKDSRSASHAPTQMAMQQANLEIEPEIREAKRWSMETRLAARKHGMTDYEYRRFLPAATEFINPDDLTKKAVDARDAVLKNLPERLRDKPEIVDDWVSRVEYLRKDMDEVTLDALRRSGRVMPLTKQKNTSYMPRKATDFGDFRAESTTGHGETGKRSFQDVLGGRNTIEDVLNDDEVWGMMQNAFKERDLLKPARPDQLETLEGMGVADTEELTRHQAAKMVTQGQHGELPPSRVQMPQDRYKKDIPDAVRELVMRKHFRLKDEWFDEWNTLRETPPKQLDEAQQGALAAMNDIAEQAGLLSKAVGARPEHLVKGKVPFFGNDPLKDWLTKRTRDMEHGQYGEKILELIGRSATHITQNEEWMKYLAQKGRTEFVHGEYPKGYVPLKHALRSATKPLGKVEHWDSPLNMSFAIKAVAPDLHKAGLISDEVLENMVGEHAVYESGLGEVWGAANDTKELDALIGKLSPQAQASLLKITGATSVDDLVGKTAQAQVEKYDGLLDLNRIMVPQHIADDVGRIVDTLSDRGYMSSILKGYDKALNLTKAHLTVNFPGFHVRNAYNMLWQMIVSGSYDPAFKRFDPRAYLNPLREAGKLVRGEYVENAARYFPGQKFTDEQALERLRELAFSHNTATGQHTFHSEAADIVGPGGSQVSPDLITHALGTAPEGRPGPLGLGYLWDGWKKLWKGEPGARNPLNVMGVSAEDSGKLFGPYEGGTKTATYVESIGRTATMMARMKQGWAPDLAAAASNAAHVNYESLSTFERQVMKRLVPFYSYASRAIPFALKNLAEHPGGLTAQSIRAFEGMKGEGGFTPDFLQGSLAMPVGGVGDDGKQTFVTGLDLPFESLNDYIQYGPDAMSTVGRTLRQAGGQLAPMLQAPIELATGQTFYQGRNLRDLDPALGRLAANIVGSDEPLMNTGLLDQLLMKSPASRYISTLRQLTDRRDPLVEQLLKKPIHTLSGVRFKDVNMRQQTDFAVLDAIKEQTRGDKPFIGGSYVTVRKDKLPDLTDRQRQLLELYRERSARLRKGK